MEAILTGQDLIISTPILVLTIGLLLILLSEVMLKADWPKLKMTILIFVAALGSAFWVKDNFQEGAEIFGGFLRADPFSFFFTVLILSGAVIALLLGAGRLTEEKVDSHSEYYAQLIVASIGAILFASSAELITMFLSLEIMSMALYCLCGSSLTLSVSTESALKYFLLGSFSSAFLLYGIALLYGITGSTMIAEINSFVSTSEPSSLLYVGVGFLLIGFGFKVGAVPFHFWAPDVYQGAPSSITGYMACVVKSAAVAALLRAMWGMFAEPEVFAAWADAIWMLAIFTMTFGNFAALRQRSVKRMLAYSSIAHVGYILVAVLAPESDGGAAILFYLVSYCSMTLGAFGVLIAVTDRYTGEKGADDISRFRGLGFSRPWLGLLMAIFMFSLAGLPPGLAGLFGKFYLFNAAVKADYVGIVIIGVLNSALSCYYYLRVLVAMYFEEGDPSIEAEGIKLSVALNSALVICAILTVGLGIFSAQVYAWAAWAAASV